MDGQELEHNDRRTLDVLKSLTPRPKRRRREEILNSERVLSEPYAVKTELGRSCPEFRKSQSVSPSLAAREAGTSIFQTGGS